MSKILNLFRNLSIRNRLLLVFSTIFVAAILLENLLLLAFVRQFATAAIKKQLKISTGYVMNMVKTSVDVSVRNHLRAVAENMHSMVGLVYAEYREGILSEEAAKSMVEGIIREQTIGRTGYIYLLNGRGTVVYHPEKALVGEDMSGLTFVQKQLNQKRGYTEYEWKNPGEAAEREKTVHWVYFQPWDWLISVSVYRDEFDAIFNVDDFKESILTMTLGKSGYPYVMDSQGNLIIHPVPQEANIYDRKDADGREIIKEICRLKTGSIVYPAVIPGRKEPRQVLEIFNYLPDLDWIVTATVYLDELYEPFLTLYFACLVTILLVLLLVFSMTWWISSSISNTFRDLMDNLSIGAMGDYSKRLSVRGSGEIGRLTEYYNTFMERLEVSNGELKRHRDQLENLVAERTEALTVTNRSLEKEIIEHNRAEEELVKKAGLQEEIFTNTPSAVFVKDIYGRYILVNKQAERMMGVSQNEVVNRSMDQVAPKKSVEAFIEEDRQIVETRESFKKTITREIEGKTRTFSVTKFPLIDAKGEVYAIGGVASDITDLLEARQRAEAANTAKSEFLANMSHEIRTPLNAILGFTEILESQIGDPRHRQYLTSVSSSGQSLLELINDILDLSKVEAGKLELEYSAFDPRTVFEEMRRIFSKKLTDKGLEFLLEIGPDLPQAIVLDETRFRQILLNLLGNAIKFTNDGYVKLGARLHVAGQDFAHPELEVFVEDTGVGISEDQRDMIFGAFEQQAGQSSAQFGGTGLGLTISRRLAEMMGGTIVLTSETGKGSRFSVIFEDMETAATADQKEKEDRGDPELVGFEKARILIADDIKLNRRLLADFLKNYDLEIVEAENGREAVDKAVEYKPDLILMDMKMPVLDGKEATRQIKADSETSRIPVIAVTASVMKEEQERIGRICDALLVKPVSKSDLVFEMAGFLNHSLAESAAARHDIAPSVATEGGPSERSKTDPSERPGQEVLSGLSDLMDILTKERDDVWEGLRETLTVNDIEAFAQRLIELDDAFHYRPLKTWADDLLQQAVMFDVEALPVTLNRFPDLIREISALIGD